MNTCLNHVDRAANFVCAVCAKYFCEECVGERFYPRPGYICHQCSGEQPAKEPEPLPQHPKDVKPSSKASETQTSVLTASIEWAVIGVCVTVILGLGIYRYSQPEWEPRLLSNAPEDLATYCLSVVNAMAADQQLPTLSDVSRVCPAPMVVESGPSMIVVTTPDGFEYGYSQIEIELDPIAITVSE